MKRTITLFLLLCATSLFAQVPEKFSYQAVVRNASNSLVADAPVGVRVSILQGSADGSAVYVETQTATTNANGLLTIEIGGGKAEQGEFAGIDWANGPFFLKTETDPNGGSSYTVTSTQQLLSVPYAIYAKEAANGFSGDYNDLKNKPAIPQNVGELTNDAGYITMSDLPHSPKSGGADDAGVVQTTACGEIDLCQMANLLAQQQSQLEELEQMRAALSPTVITGAVSFVTENTANCSGTVIADGYSGVVWRGVCWGTDPNPTVSGSHTYNGSGTGDFTSQLAGLAPNTTYYVRAYATNSVGTAYGAEVSFTTAASCTAITLPYSEDFESYTTSTTASTGVLPDCWRLVRTEVSMPDDKKPQLYYNSNFAHSGNYSLKMGNRCVYAMPVLSVDVQVSQLKLEMYLRQANAAYQLEVGVWDDETGTFERVQLINNSTTGVMRVECDFSSYTGNGHRIAFRNVLGGSANYDYSYNYLDDITLDTISGGTVSATLPTVNTSVVSNITETAVTCGGVVTDDGYAEVTGRGVCWGTEHNPTVAGSHTSDGSGTGTFTSSITGLAASTTYYVRAYATNSAGTAYGEEMIFTTMEANPCGTTITLPYSEDFESYTTSTTAVTGVQPDCWSLVRADVSMTDANRPQLYYNSNFAHSGSYSLKLYNRGIYAMPALSDSVELNRVKLAMYLRQANARYQLQVGIWEEDGTFVPVATFNNSTTGVEHVSCDFSSYIGSGRRIAFRNTLGSGSNLNYSTNYLDDIVLNLIGEAVVDEKSCSGTPTVTDHEGNVYATVQIGNQCWMRDNLRTTTSPSTGTYLIPPAGTTPTYTGKQARWYNNDSATYAPMNYGLLYNWNAAVDTFNTAYGETSVNTDDNNGVSVTFSGHRRGICPAGWHLPSDAEWAAMANYVRSQSEYVCGGNKNTWNIAKALAASVGWISSTNTCAVGNNQGANNATGFSAVPAGISEGYCDSYCDSAFYHAGYDSGFWSATHYHSNYYSLAWTGVYLYHDWAEAYDIGGSGDTSYGMSVRCLRD